MEKLLFGVLFSDNRLSLKKAFAVQVARAGSSNIEFDAFSNMVSECSRNLYGEGICLGNDLKELILVVLKEWLLNVRLTKRYLDERLSIEAYRNYATKDKKIILQETLFMLNHMLRRKQKISAKVKQFYFDTFMCTSDLQELALICFAYIEYPFLLPKELLNNVVQDVADVFIKVLSSTSISNYIAFEKQDGSNLQDVFKLLSMLVENNNLFVKNIANNLFQLLTEGRGTQPSICVSQLLDYLNLDEAILYLNKAVQSQLSDDQLVLMTCRFIDWICFPNSKATTDQWVLEILKSLLQRKKYQVLSTVIEAKIVQVNINWYKTYFVNY